MVTTANDSRIGRECRGIVGDSALKVLTNVGEFVDFVVELTKEFAPAGGRRHYEILQDRELAEGLAQRDEFARSGQTEGDAAGEAFEVEDPAKFFSNFAAHDRLLNQVSYRREARLDGVAVEERAQKPGAQEARAHAGNCNVQCGDQCRRS